MNWEEFARWGRKISNWGKEYHTSLRDRPVRAPTKPGDIAKSLPASPPETPQSMEAIWADFEKIILPGMTHWQHPRFFAYFPSNASPPSILGEMLSSVMAAQCMLWQTSPAATELEGVMINWLREAMQLPQCFSGVIQDSASSATLSAVLTMRERATNWTGNREGLSAKGRLRIYCSEQVHSSIDRACWVAGIGQDNLVKIGTGTSGHAYEIDPNELKDRIIADRKAGHIPAGIIAITGGTGIGAWDFLEPVVAIARAENLYTHLDAAWAGAAMICPEFRERFWGGVEEIDSIVFNPHKWLGVQFDCSVQFLKNPQEQRDTLRIEPEYLKTTGEAVTNYSEWTIPLGRRFRALKLWFLIRTYGMEALRDKIRHHVLLAQEACGEIRVLDGFEIVTEPVLSLFTFRGPGDNEAQQRLVDALNDDGRIYVTQGMHEGRKIVRFQVGQFETTREDIMTAIAVIREISGKLK